MNDVNGNRISNNEASGKNNNAKYYDNEVYHDWGLYLAFSGSIAGWLYVIIYSAYLINERQEGNWLLISIIFVTLILIPCHIIYFSIPKSKRQGIIRQIKNYLLDMIKNIYRRLFPNRKNW